MPRIYSAVFKNISVTALQDFYEILAGANKSIKIHAWQLAQSTEIGDAMEEGLLITCNRGVGSTTGNGTATTAAPLGVDNTACGATVKINGTTRMTAGTITELETHVWNVRAPYTMIYTPELRPFVKAGDRWTLELETAPLDVISMSGTIWFEEMD